MAEWIGGLAAVFTAASFVPQAVKLILTRDTAGVSLTTYLLSAAASVLWVVFGSAIGSVSVIACNAVIGVLAAIIAVLKVRNGSAQEL
jgi:MtN3 and saliva related transmembrane protein